MSNLALWNDVQTTDPNYTKKFTRTGGFSGTAINFTHLAKKATEKFGPCGIGWGWTVDDDRIVEGANADKIHVLRVTLWYEWQGKRGQITHFGQTAFTGRNRSGEFTDEEAPKKSLTDALSKCLSMLGFAADVHLGLYDDNKYVNDLREEFANENRSPGRAASKSEPAADARSDQRPDEPEAPLDERMKRAIDSCQSVNAVTDFMLKPKVQQALSEMDRIKAEEIRSYAQARMKDLGWKGGRGKTPDPAPETSTVTNPSSSLPSDAVDRIKQMLDAASSPEDLQDAWIEADAGATLHDYPALLDEVIGYYNARMTELGIRPLRGERAQAGR